MPHHTAGLSLTRDAYMSDYTPIPTHWYSAQEAAIQFNVPLEQMEAIYRQAIERHTTGVAYYYGPDTPLIIGAYIIKRLTGVEHAV